MNKINNDMFGKIKNAKAIAAKALGQVELKSKLVSQDKPAKAELDVETKTSKNSTSESAEGQVEVKSKLLPKLKIKKSVADTEVKNTKSKLVEESSADPKPVKKVSDEVTKAKLAKTIAKAKKVDAKETPLK